MAEFPHIFIQAPTREVFEAALTDGRVSQHQVAFIEDTHEIWARGKYYPCPYTKAEIDQMIKNLNDSKVDLDTYNAAIEKLENSLKELPVADEEDITVTANNKLQLKDRDTSNGMGYRILRLSEDGILTQDMINEPNTIYEIRYDFDLNGETITIPENCILKFEGGKLSNGKISNGTIENEQNTDIFSGLDLQNVSMVASPKWFGAKGDGINDDTDALRYCLFQSSKNDFTVRIKLTDSYLISDSLNFYNDTYNDIILHVQGDLTIRPGGTPGTYEPLEHVKNILVSGPVSVFKGSEVSGTISNVGIRGNSINNSNSYLFSNCYVQNIIVRDSYITRLEAMFFNSGVWQTSRITGNKISCYFFGKIDVSEPSDVGLKKGSCFVDSFIDHNYISGTGSMSITNTTLSNYAFGWSEYNGSTISNNFIDYFRTIYQAVKGNGSSVLSIGNQYQVFRYFHSITNVYQDQDGTVPYEQREISIHSISDSFNWVDENSLEYLGRFKPLYYKKADSYTGSAPVVKIPPYIVACNRVSSFPKLYSNMKIENHISNNVVLFLENPLRIDTLYGKIFSVDVSFDRNFNNTSSIRRIDTDNCFSLSEEDISEYPGTISINAGYEVLSEIPSTPNGIGKYSFPVGYKIRVENNTYTLKVIRESDSYKYIWDKENPNLLISQMWKIIR